MLLYEPTCRKKIALKMAFVSFFLGGGEENLGRAAPRSVAPRLKYTLLTVIIIGLSAEDFIAEMLMLMMMMMMMIVISWQECSLCNYFLFGICTANYTTDVNSPPNINNYCLF